MKRPPLRRALHQFAGYNPHSPAEKKVEKITLLVKEVLGIERKNEPVTFGIPFPEGALRAGEALTLHGPDNSASGLQFSPLALWPDKSLKWALMDFQASAGPLEESRYAISKHPSIRAAYQAVRISEDDRTLSVDTGKSLFCIDKKVFKPFGSVRTGGADVIDGAGNITLTDGKGNNYEPEIRKITIETRGEARSTVKIDGGFGGLLQFTARLSFFAGKSFVKIDFTVRNPNPARHPSGLWDLGDPGSVLVKDLSLKVRLKNAEAGAVYSTGSGSPPVKFSGTELIIYQDSSGAENWKSSNHVNRLGKVPNSFRGYEVRDRHTVIDRGLRANPVVFIGDMTAGVSGAIRSFWQNFPKSIEAKGAALNIRLFPGHYSDLHEIQGGEQKTHTIFLDFSPDPQALNWVQAPLLPVAPPEWYARSRAFDYLNVNPKYRDTLYERLVSAVTEGGNTFFDRREIIDEYGWRNFGEVYADHEAVGHKGPSPLVSHYNNQYDFIYSAARQFAGKSSLAWHTLMDELARHVIDIDIYHTCMDRDEFNGGLFWHTNHYLDAATCTHRTESKGHLKSVGSKDYGTGPGSEHNYARGLTHHYFLTGNEASKEAVLELAAWTLRLNDTPGTLVSFAYSLKKKLPGWKKALSRQKVRADRHPFTRGSGNSINTLLDAYSLTGEDLYLRKAEEIIRGCIHPDDDIESRNLLDVERNWSYTVCLQALGRYLDLKSGMGEEDNMYSYSKKSLIHYARWMLKNERPYLDCPEILEFPNETWPAQDLRKSCVFYLAAKHTGGQLRESFIGKAEFFHDYAINKLNVFETKTLARPLALLLQNGGLHYYFLDNPGEPAGETENAGEPRREGEFWSVGLMIKRSARGLLDAIKKTSIKKEARWIRCRRNRQI